MMMVGAKSKIAVIFTAMFYSLCCKMLFAHTVIDGKNSITIKGVRVEGISMNDTKTTKENALFDAKKVAFEIAQTSMKYDDIQIDPVNIDACISSFTILDENYNEDFYSMLANFTFSKELLASVAKKTIENKKGGGEVVDLIVILKEQKDVISEYVVFRDFLKKEKISFFPSRITATEIEVKIFKVLESKIYLQLKQLGLNGSIHLD